MTYIESLGEKAKKAARILAKASSSEKDKALAAISKAIAENTDKIMAANEKDLESAEKNGINDVMKDRLRLTPDRINDIAAGIDKLISLSDPVGIIDYGVTAANGMRITRISVPIGVIGMIYESRPNVTADAGTLCLKSGNAVILRGGKEAYNSNREICRIMSDAIEKAGLPRDSVLFVDDTTHEVTTELMKCGKYIDLLIPRGSARLINAVKENASVPIIETGVGNCHIYVDASADIEMAVNITDNAKTQRPSVCNAAESLLVHKNIANDFLPVLAERFNKHNVELHGCERTRKILGSQVIPASEEDYAKEYLDYKMSVKIVDTTEEAIEHIAKYSSGHSECIVTNSLDSAEKFRKGVDSACVYVNASTRFTDGGQFGLGAEIGISTQKMHVRGPMGLQALTSIKYLIDGNGQIR